MLVSELHGYNLAGQLDSEELNKTGMLDTKVRRVQAGEKFKEAAGHFRGGESAARRGRRWPHGCGGGVG